MVDFLLDFEALGFARGFLGIFVAGAGRGAYCVGAGIRRSSSSSEKDLRFKLGGVDPERSYSTVTEINMVRNGIKYITLTKTYIHPNHAASILRDHRERTRAILDDSVSHLASYIVHRINYTHGVCHSSAQSYDSSSWTSS